MDADRFASECVYLALFRVVEVGELDDAEAAVAWAERALASEELRQGLIDGVKERMVDRELAASVRFARGED
jgi:hypothetical protein